MKGSLIIFYVFLITILILRLHTFYSNQKTYTKGQEISFETQILSFPKTYTFYQTVYVNLDKTTKVLIRTDLDRQLNYGDYVKVSGTLDTILLSSGGTIFTLNNPEIEANFRENNPFLSSVYFIRQKIIDNFNSSLDPVSSSLLLGIVFGIKENMPKDFLDKIQITGVMHVVAASGMNVTMVSGFLFYLLGSLLKRQFAIALSIFGVIFYTALAGFEPSIIRAAIMGILVFSAQVLGRQQYSLNTLLITGAFMLFLWPQFVTDTGFALSFTATAGILFIPLFFQKVKNSFTEVFITTTSAQIATLPILIGAFGSFSLLSILVNALVLWTIPVLMILGAVAAFFGFIFKPAAVLFLYLSLPFLYFFEQTVYLFSELGVVVTFDNVPWQFSAGYYLLLISIILFLNKKNEKVFNS
ncbi:MAG: hypothetical protein COU25_03310 [Candidatus Levybacteria bacterium CG10_big_fil_rev_8_21_14_0_10_35_13]|nr:MAG: hypothetical protein COU25_03310 [Candidatus Levybacteria bacterium CG10_big_fil_rev_8_21_14_0_10_35_13]